VVQNGEESKRAGKLLGMVLPNRHGRLGACRAELKEGGKELKWGWKQIRSEEAKRIRLEGHVRGDVYRKQVF
jgi:hypothetical protein